MVKQPVAAALCARSVKGNMYCQRTFKKYSVFRHMKSILKNIKIKLLRVLWMRVSTHS